MADSYIPLFGRRDRSRGPTVVRTYAVVDEADADRLSRWRWSVFDNGGNIYAIRRLKGTRERIFMHREVLALERGCESLVDHINGDGLDNRRANLRLLTNTEQQQNRCASKTSATGLRGVFKDPRNPHRPWIAKHKLNGKKYHIGSFATPEQAADAAREWRVRNMPYSVEVVTHVPHADALQR